MPFATDEELFAALRSRYRLHHARPDEGVFGLPCSWFGLSGGRVLLRCRKDHVHVVTVRAAAVWAMRCPTCQCQAFVTYPADVPGPLAPAEVKLPKESSEP